MCTQKKDKIKLAIIGSRGFLVDYGGFETFTKQLAVGLSRNSFEITVYGVRKYHNSQNDKCYPNIKRIWMSSVKQRFLEKAMASWLALVHASFSRNEVLLLLGVSPGLLQLLPLILGKTIVVNVDGVEWRREKWPELVSFFLRLSEVCSIFLSHSVIADSKAISEYLVKKYNKNSIYIPYGTEPCHFLVKEELAVLNKFGLRPKGYFLQICRLEPENNVHFVIREFLDYKGSKSLVVIGDTPHSIEYKLGLLKESDGRIRFLGAIYGRNKDILLNNAYCYIHAHEAGGTNPSLLEAMGFGKCPVVLNTTYNCEVTNDIGMSFKKVYGDLSRKLTLLDENPNLVEQVGVMMQKRARKSYNWSTVISDYDKLFNILGRVHIRQLS